MQKCPPTLATHSRGGAETTSTMKLAWDLVSPLEEKVKVSRFSLSLGETDVFHKPKNHELTIAEKIQSFFKLY